MQIKEKTMKRGRTNKDEKVALYKLFSFADTWDKVLMSTGFLAAISNGLAMPIMTMIFGELINAFGVADRDSIVHEVSKVVVKYVYLALGAGLAAFLQVSCWMVTGERQAARIRGLYLKTILRQDISFFDMQTSTGEVTARMTGNTILIQDAIGEKVGKFIQLLSTFLGGIVVAFTRGWFLSLVLLACIPPTVLAGAAMSLILSKLAIKSQLAYAEAGNVVEQTVGSIRTVVSFTGEKNAIEKYNGFLKLAYEMAVHQGAIIGLGFGSLMFFIFSSYALAIWYGSKLIIEKGYNGGTIINIIVALMTGSMSLGQTSPCINAFASGQAAAYKMFNTIHRKPLIDSYDTKGIILPIIRGDIELKNIRFSYPARPDQIIFESFSLQVPHGTTMALVGESGSGKSTVISLVERFYDPDHGKVMIDGVNLKEMRLSWIRESIGLVSQEPILFTTSIRENIEFGNKNATKIELRRAIELANAVKFIDKLPNGLDTMVGEHGTQLSGGQKQRIAIARAILKNPKILLLDEATSALDAESEKVVQDALSKLMQGRTTIVVAHRLSTIKNADMISVVHRGKLIEQGSHAELTRNPEGAYSQLIQLQDHANSETKEELISARSSMDRSVTRSESSHGSIRMTAEDHTVQDYQSNDCKKQRKEVSLTRLAYLNKSETHVLLLGSAVAAISGVIMPIFGALLSITIKMFYGPVHELRNDARFWSLIYVALGVVYLVALPVQYYLFGVAGAKLIERIRSSCFERVVHQEISWFDDPSNSSGAIGARLSIDAAYVRGLVGDSLSLMVQNLATLLAGLIIAMFANWKLAFIVLCILPCIGAEAYVHIKFLQGFSADAKKKYEEASTVANDAVRSIRTVASFCAEHEVMDTYEKKCYSTIKHGLRQGVLSGIGYGFSYMLLYCSYALCFYVGARFVHAGSATFSQVFRVFFALTMAATRISQSSASAPDVNKAKNSASSIFEILDRKSKIDSSSYNGTELATVKGAIEFQHVGFRYPIRPDIEIFKDLCLKIPPGKTIAIVGESGSGKSTIIALLERFYDPDSGSILLDGVDLQSLKINWLRQQIGLVGQEPVVFNGTIASNIAYSKPGNVSQEEIVAASKAANAHSFISALRDGYNTSVGECGIQLSGGQKQRVAIARAILKNPRILLLDEATSALDAESERTVQEALDQVMVGRTSIIVAHRLSTILNASKIAVVKDGAIAEQGRHEDLIRVVGGAYASLVALHSNCS